jgi:hypothetical protein
VSSGAGLIACAPERLEAHRQPPILPEGKPALRSDVGRSGLREKDSEEEQFSRHQIHEHVESVSRKHKSPDVREALYEVEEALTRLEWLSFTIRQAYVKNPDDSEFNRRTGLILSWLFDKLDSGLAGQLCESIVCRYYRLLYQRRHWQRVQSERPETNPIESKRTVKPALQIPRGLGRQRAVVPHWVKASTQGTVNRRHLRPRSAAAQQHGLGKSIIHRHRRQNLGWLTFNAQSVMRDMKQQSS